MIVVRFFRGTFRLFVYLVVLVMGAIPILLTAWMPFTYRGVRLSAWPATMLARFFMRLFRVQVTYYHLERLQEHQGFIFPNHVSFLDIIMMLHLMPMRFLSKAELRHWPLIGWIARAIGTVFVDRGNKSSREAARNALTQVTTFPPIVLFPEGGIFPPPEALKPFRYGAFEIAQSGMIPYLPCVLTYEPMEIAFWGDESIWVAAWRFAAFAGPIRAHLHVLRKVQPHENDDPHQLALETHGAMDAVLRYGGHEADVLQAGL